MAKWKSGGIKTSTTVGTAVQISSTQVLCRAISFQALPKNVGWLVIGDSAVLVAGTIGTNPTGSVCGILGAASGVTTPPETSVDVGGDTQIGSFDIRDYWLDVAASGDGIAWSYIPFKQS